MHRLLAALALVCIWFAAPAAAADVHGRACYLFSDQKLSFRQAVSATDWNCAATRKSVSAAHSWLRVSGSVVPSGQLAIKGDAIATDGVLVAEIYRDGSRKQTYWPEAAIAERWTAGTYYTLPLAQDGSQLQSLFLRFDRPLDPIAITSIELVDAEDHGSAERGQLILTSLISGMLIIVAVLSVLMAWAIRSAYAFWHFVGISFVLVYIASSSSLIFIPLPDLGLWGRTYISYASLALAVAALTPFILALLEPDVIPRWARRLLVGAAVITASAALFVPLGKLLGFNPRFAYYMAFIPSLVAGGVVITHAWRNGSRAAKAFVFAWIGPFTIGAERILRVLGLSTLGQAADFAFYFAIMMEAFAMTVVIGWRVEQLRKERDVAVVHGEKLADEALHDALTGLRNRRDFNRRKWRKTDVLALIDLDRFKAVNDTYGHAVGDRMLEIVGRVLKEATHRAEVLESWRLGGEEFAVAVSGSSLSDAAIIINQVRCLMTAEIAAHMPEVDRPTSASAGLCQIGGSMTAAFKKADNALYYAKSCGRDRLCYVTDEGVTATVSPRRLAA